MGMGMGVTGGPALETFKPEQTISWCGEKQGWEAGAGQAGLREQKGCEADTLQGRWRVILGVGWP